VPSGRPGDIDVTFIRGSHVRYMNIHMYSPLYIYLLMVLLYFLKSIINDDVSPSLGYGWPTYKGGPLFYAEKYVTLPLLLQRLEKFSQIYPNSEYYKPAKLLEAMVKEEITVFDIQLNPSILKTLMEKINKEIHILKSFL
jgi:hypothetical protein